MQLGIVSVTFAVKQTDYTGMSHYPINGVLHSKIVFTRGGKMIHALYQAVKLYHCLRYSPAPGGN